jgi:hypothetical protein
MRDFTFDAYRQYLESIQAAYKPVLRFDEYLRLAVKPACFAMIRHDVDRRPLKALRMAQLENQMGIRCTYYFRVKPHVFNPRIIRAIRRLGHEIGYHYETLSDTRGDHAAAAEGFRNNLKRLRLCAPINTIAMHGRPFSPYNNLDLWRSRKSRSQLIDHHDILGEIYLDIDYRDVAYICDTGRNWDQKRSNRRDLVNTNVNASLKNGVALLRAINNKRWQKIVFQVHPERWSENEIEYFLQYLNDSCINLVKKWL